MSQEQERLVRQAMKVLNEGDIEGIVALTSPDAEYELIGGL